ncbi:MAG: hypothetical protein ABIF77_02525 [bacterium]
MAGRKAFPLRLNEELYAELRRWAAAEFRSVNGQIEYLLQRAVNEHKKQGAGESDLTPP